MTTCYQLSGAGNDFLAVAEPGRPPTSDEIRAWCRRGLSLGADGVFSLARADGQVRMIHFNADGQLNSLCVNASRCAARLAFHLGWAVDEVALETGAGILQARCLEGERIALDVPPIIGTPDPLGLPVGETRHSGWHLEVSVPHFILPWATDLSTAPVVTLGPVLRRHPALGAAGANISFTHTVDAQRLEIRTFERGVEAETLACGGGVIAAAAAGIAAEQLKLPIHALTRGGFVLDIDGRIEDGRLVSCTVSGDARLLARTTLLPGAGRLPSAPPW